MKTTAALAALAAATGIATGSAAHEAEKWERLCDKMRHLDRAELMHLLEHEECARTVLAFLRVDPVTQQEPY